MNRLSSRIALALKPGCTAVAKEKNALSVVGVEHVVEPAQLDVGLVDDVLESLRLPANHRLSRGDLVVLSDEAVARLRPFHQVVDGVVRLAKNGVDRSISEQNFCGSNCIVNLRVHEENVLHAVRCQLGHLLLELRFVGGKLDEVRRVEVHALSGCLVHEPLHEVPEQCIL